MVELYEGVYDYDSIPFASASIVAIDAELLDDSIVTAEAIPSSPESSITTSAHGPYTPTAPEEDLLYTNHYEESSHSSYSNELIDDNNSHEETLNYTLERQRVLGAGTAGAVLGLLMGGPVLSLVFGFGTVYFTKQEGPTGDLARALGDIALVARDKWKEVDSKHHIVDRSREAAKEAIQNIQEADRKHHGRERFFKFVGYCWKTTCNFVERHRLVDRGCDRLKLLAENVATKVHEHHYAHHHRVQACGCHQPRGHGHFSHQRHCPCNIHSRQ